MKQAAFDPARLLYLYFRIKRAGSKTFTLVDGDGVPINVGGIYTDYGFELFIKRYSGAREKTISLTIGSGLVINGNQLIFSVTSEDTNVIEGEYFWELYLNETERTWLNGKAIFHNGEFDGVNNDTETITISEDGETIEITVQDSLPSSEGSGDVEGPASSTDNALARFSGTTGKDIDQATTPIKHNDDGSLVFPANATNTYERGKLVYNSTDECLEFFNNEDDVALQIGQEEWIMVRNDTGSTIVNGAPVYISGSSGGIPRISLADADAEATAIVVGVATMSIPNNTIGYVTRAGKVRGLNTSSWAAGDRLYLSATAGTLTNVAPSAPTLVLPVAVVLVSNATTGVILIRLGTLSSNFLLYKNSTPTTITGTTNETLIESFLIPAGTLQANDILEVWAVATKSGSAGTLTLRLNVNTSVSLAGDTQVAVLVGASGNLWHGMTRRIHFVNSLTSQLYYNAASQSDDATAAGSAPTLGTTDFSVDQYFTISLTNASAADTSTFRGWFIKVLR